MDLTKLTDSDFQALRSGNLAAMSDSGFSELMKTTARETPRSVKEQRMREQAEREYAPTVGMSQGQLLAAGAGKAVSDMGTAVKQSVGKIDRAGVDEIKRRDAPLMSTTAGKVGYVSGVAAPALASSMIPGAGTVLGATAIGSALGALSPLGTEDDLLRNVLFGGGAGGLTTLGLNAVGVGLAPKATPQAQSLARQGATLTPGQQLGGKFARIEQAAESVPVLGDAIRAARRRSFESFNRVVADDALKPIGRKLPAGVTGHDAVQFVDDAIGDVYEAALKRTGSIRADQVFGSEIGSLKNMVRSSPMPPDVKAQFDTVIRNQITGKLQGQTAMTAQTFKEVDSEIGRLAAKYGADASVDKQLLGDALHETQAILRRWLQRTAPSGVAQDVAAANAAWAKYVRMQVAAARQTSADGIFTPEAYRAAVRAADQSLRKGNFGKGSALGQDLAEDAMTVLGSKVPDSGTALRTAVNHPVQSAVLGTATAPMSAAYASPAVMRAAQILLSGQRPALATKAAAELEMLAPYLSGMGISAANAYQRGAVR